MTVARACGALIICLHTIDAYIHFYRNTHLDDEDYSQDDKIAGIISGIFLTIILFTIITCGCFCCCGLCGDPPKIYQGLFESRYKPQKNNAKICINKGYEQMTKADNFLKIPYQHTLAIFHLEDANKNLETALKLLNDQNKLYHGQNFAEQVQDNNELISSVERTIYKNARKIRSLQDYCANLGPEKFDAINNYKESQIRVDY